MTTSPETSLPDAVAGEDLVEVVADFGGLAVGEPLGPLHEGHARAEPREELPQLDPDGTAADDDDALRNLAEIGRLPIGPVAGFHESGDRRNDGFGTSGEDDRLRLEHAAVRLDLVRTGDPAALLQDGDPARFVALDPRGVVVARDHVVPVGRELRPLERRGHDAGRAHGLPLQLGRTQERLRGDATPVRALASDDVLLEKGDP
jgi:hypothetical protein